MSTHSPCWSTLICSWVSRGGYHAETRRKCLGRKAPIPAVVSCCSRVRYSFVAVIRNNVESWMLDKYRIQVETLMDMLVTVRMTMFPQERRKN